MSYRWTLSPEADESIIRQSQWYLSEVADGGWELASRWNSGLEMAIEKMAQHPLGHGFAPESGNWLPELEIRQLLFRPWKSGAAWRVLYTIDDQEKLVTILQVRHEHRRWMHASKEGEA